MKFKNDSSYDVSFEGEVGKRSPEDDVSRGNTEDSLLSSQASSVDINKSGDVACCAERNIERGCCSKFFPYPIYRVSTGNNSNLYMENCT